MGNSDLAGEPYESEDDDALLADIQALSSACLDSSARNGTGEGGAAQSPGVAAANNFGTADVSSDSDDDFEFLRDVQLKYGGGDAADSAAAPPLVFSDSDSDDDFEMLRAIQRRFGQYSAVGTSGDGDGEAQGMPGTCNLNSPVDEILETGVSDRFEDKEEGFGDSSRNVRILGDDAESQTSQNSKLPKSALMFIDAIRKNRLAQKHIRSKMLSAEARIGKIKEMIKRVKIIYEFDVHERKKMERKRQDDRVQLISVPGSDKRVPLAMRRGPQENSRVVNYRNAFAKYPQWVAKERWTKEERRNLQKGVTQQVQKWLLLKSMDRINENEGSECVDGVDGIMSRIGDVEVNPQMIRSFLPNVDWDDLASMYLPRRSGRECQARWINYEDPLINKDKWTQLEDKSLLLTLQQKGHNWVAVIESLGTNRTVYQCLARFQRSLNPSLIKREWSAAEDAELTAAVQAYGESNWTVVASVLDGRTGPQCSNRWLKTLLPSKQRKGRWKPDEDIRLRIAVMLMGSKCWNKIAEFVPGRTQARCRDRWVNCLDPSLNLGKWTEEEDAKLEEAIRVHGYCWAKVASCVPPRTDNQCLRRWKTLFPNEAFRLQAERKVTRTILPSNFVDREPNRPAFGVNDLLTSPLEVSKVGNADSSRKRKKMSTRRKKSCKVVDVDFCNVPKKPRSGRCRRMARCWEFPVIHHCHSSGMPSKKRRVKGSGIKQKKPAYADASLTDPKKSVEGAHKKRKRRVNETADQSEHAHKKRKGGVNETADQSEHTEVEGMESRSGDSIRHHDSNSGPELGNCSGDNIRHHYGDETAVSHTKINGKKRKRRRLNPVESEEWDQMPLAILFQNALKSRKRMVK